MLRGLFRRSDKKNDHVYFISVKRQSVRGESKNKFRRRKVFHTQVRYGYACANTTVALIVLIGRVGMKLRFQMVERQAIAKLIEGCDKISFEPEEYPCNIELFRDHGCPG